MAGLSSSCTIRRLRIPYWKRSLRVECPPCRLQGLILFAVVLLPLWATAAELTIPYEVQIRGVHEKDLLKGLEAVSDAVSLKDRPPASRSLLRSRAERDQTEFSFYLRAMGYYGAQVEAELAAETVPVQVIFQVTTGPPYLLKAFDLKMSAETEASGLILPGPDRLGLVVGEPFKTESLLEAEKRMLQFLGRKGFPYPKIVDRKVIVDHADHSVAVSLLVDAGPGAVFGRVEIEGLESASERLIQRKIPWKEGDLFNSELLASLQKELIELGLFSSVRVSQGEALEGGRVPVIVSVKERKHRSVAAGVSYRTDERLGFKLSWENRNLLGEGERLGLVGTLSDLSYAAEGGFRKPYFLREDQALNLTSRLARDEPEGYTSVNLTNTALLVRDMTKSLKLGGGVGFKEAEITQLGSTNDYSLLFLPLQLSWDRSDNLLDPSRGGRLGIQLAPYHDLFKEDLNFLKGKVSYGHYLQILDSPSTVLAGRVSMGLIGAEERMEIPADERFYAGGGGSVRGYAYQSLGPRAGGIPTGGRSLLEVSLENRMKITERVGLVFFVDGGNAFAETTPSADETLFWGTGVGFRYFTPIGPFRLDVAFPINRRDGLDDSFHIYVSLGQAF
jgi:translocation and assembly module TamA